MTQARPFLYGSDGEPLAAGPLVKAQAELARRRAEHNARVAEVARYQQAQRALNQNASWAVLKRVLSTKGLQAWSEA